MQVQLKQTEIIAALKQFITAQGINLAGKDVNITFTAGRKEAGIIADVSIEDVSIPGFTDEEVEEAVKASDAPALKVVPTVAKAAIATEAVAEPVAQAQAETADEQPEEPAPKTTSLFN
jgi:hypothetical protein